MDPTLANTIGERLLRYSDVFVNFGFEYPGYIALRTDAGGVWVIGTADEVWGADLYIAEDSYIAGELPDCSIQTSIRPDLEATPEMIADALFQAMTSIPN